MDEPQQPAEPASQPRRRRPSSETVQTVSTNSSPVIGLLTLVAVCVLGYWYLTDDDPAPQVVYHQPAPVPPQGAPAAEAPVAQETVDPCEYLSQEACDRVALYHAYAAYVNSAPNAFYYDPQGHPCNGLSRRGCDQVMRLRNTRPSAIVLTGR